MRETEIYEETILLLEEQKNVIEKNLEKYKKARLSSSCEDILEESNLDIYSKFYEAIFEFDYISNSNKSVIIEYLIKSIDVSKTTGQYTLIVKAFKDYAPGDVYTERIMVKESLTKDENIFLTKDEAIKYINTVSKKR